MFRKSISTSVVLGMMISSQAYSASRTIPFIGHAKSALITEIDYLDPLNLNIPAYPTLVTLTCTIILTNISVARVPPLVPAPQPPVGVRVTGFRGSFRLAPSTIAATQDMQHGPAPGAPGALFYVFTSGAAAGGVITPSAIPSPLLGGWAQPNNSFMIQMRASFPLRGGVGNAGAGAGIAKAQPSLPEFCVGDVTVTDDPAANAAGSVIGTGSLEYVANSPANYQRGTQFGVEIMNFSLNVEAAYTSGCARFGGIVGPAVGCRTAEGTQIDSQIMELGPQLYGLPHRILNVTFPLNGGLPF